MSAGTANLTTSQESTGFVIEEENGRATWSPLKAKKEWSRIVFLAVFWAFWTWGTIMVTLHGFSRPMAFDKLFLVWGWIFTAGIPVYFINALLPTSIECRENEIVVSRKTVLGKKTRVIPIREITKIGFRLRGRGSQSTLTIVSKSSFFWSKKEDIGDFLSLKLKQQIFLLLRSWVTAETSPVSYFPYGE